RLQRLEWALKEAERMHPVAYIIQRLAAEHFELSGYRIAKGTRVFAAPWVSHRLEEVFRSPESYDPERFAPPRLEAKVPHSLVGCGGSTHRCSGVNFAYQEMKVILTLLLQRYEFELLDGPAPVEGANTKWPSPCRIKYRQRASSPRTPSGGG